MHIYILYLKALVRDNKVNKYEDPYIVLYPIIKVCTNVTVDIRLVTAK